MDSPDPELQGSMSRSYISSQGMKINQSQKKIKILTMITVLALLSTWNWKNRIVSTEPEYKKTNSSFIKNFYCAEYDPLMPTEDDVTETSDAEAMRILEEEDESDPAASVSAAADADPNSTAQERGAPASASGSGPKRNVSGDTMDTTDPSKARMDPDPAPGSVIFKTPEGLQRRQAKAGRAATSRRLSCLHPATDPVPDPDQDPDPAPLLGLVLAAIVNIRVLSVAVSVMSSPPSTTL